MQPLPMTTPQPRGPAVTITQRTWLKPPSYNGAQKWRVMDRLKQSLADYVLSAFPTKSCCCGKKDKKKEHSIIIHFNMNHQNVVQKTVHPKMKISCKCSPSEAIQDVDEFVSSSDLEKCSIASLSQQWMLCSEWVPSEWESKQLIKTSQ